MRTTKLHSAATRRTLALSLMTIATLLTGCSSSAPIATARTGVDAAQTTQANSGSASLLAQPPASTPPTPATAQPSISAGNSSAASGARMIDSGGVIRQVQPWVFDGVNGQLVTTDHFSLYTTEKDAQIAGRMPGFLEAALDHYTHDLGVLPLPKDKLEAFIMGSHSEWRNLVLHMLGQRGQAFAATIQRGGLTYGGRAYLFGIGTTDTMSLAAHEGWHLYTQRTFAEPLPLWLEEGVATYMEGYRAFGNSLTFASWANMERFDQLRKSASAGQILSLGELLSTPPGDLVTHGSNQAALTYYAQVWALVLFLREGADGKYKAAFEQLLSDAAAGRMSLATSVQLSEKHLAEPRILAQRVGPQVFLAYFNADLGKADVEYRAFINKIVQPGSRQFAAVGQSPISGQ